MITQQRKLVTELPGPISKSLAQRRLAAVSSAVSGGSDIYVAGAEGAILLDVDGNQIIDFGSGIGVTSVGHSDPRVVAAVTEQAASFGHTCFMVNPYENYIGLCEKLAEVTPGDFEKRSVLLNSGAEAVENAVKIARSYTGRQAVVVFDHAYHGRTNLTMAMTAKVSPYKDGFGPFAPEIYRVGMAYPYRWPTGPENCAEEAFARWVESACVWRVAPSSLMAESLIVVTSSRSASMAAPTAFSMPRLRLSGLAPCVSYVRRKTSFGN